MPIAIHDAETSDIDPVFGQMLEVFAARAVRDSFAPGSDLKITEGIGKREPSLRCLLRPHTLFSPEAMAITGIDVEKVRPRYGRKKQLAHIPSSERLLTNYELHVGAEDFIWRHSKHTRMYKGGYNSGRFDNKFWEHGRYQNLLPNTDAADFRVDIDFLAFARAAAHVYPDRFVVPPAAHDPDKKTFRQGSFAPANGIDFDEEKAHGAWYDVVKGTFEIARLVKNRAGAVWDTMMRLADISAAQRMLKDRKGQIFYYVDTRFNHLKAEPLYVFWPIPRAGSTHPRSKMLAFSLDHAPGQLLRRKSIEGLTGLIDDASFRPGERNPLRVIDLRDNPFLVPLGEFEKTFGVKPQIATNPATLDYRASQLDHAQEFIQGPLHEAAEQWEIPPRQQHGDPVEKFIYANPFYVREPISTFAKRTLQAQKAKQQDLLYRFHYQAKTWEDRATIMRQLDDPHQQELALRLIGEHDFEALYPDEQRSYADFLHARLTAPEGSPWPTFESVEKRIEKGLEDTTLSPLKHKRYHAMQRALERWREEFLDWYENLDIYQPRANGPMQKDRYAITLPRSSTPTTLII